MLAERSITRYPLPNPGLSDVQLRAAYDSGGADGVKDTPVRNPALPANLRSAPLPGLPSQPPIVVVASRSSNACAAAGPAPTGPTGPRAVPTCWVCAQVLDAATLFEMVFGSAKFEPLLGELRLATIMKDVMVSGGVAGTPLPLP